MSSSTLKVLIIEDDRDISESLCEVLEYQGLSCVAVDDGLRGLELMSSEAFALALLDWRMQGLSGEEVLRLREVDDVLCQTPVLVMTALALKEEQLSHFRNVSLLRKPFDLDELLQRITMARTARQSG